MWKRFFIIFSIVSFLVLLVWRSVVKAIPAVVIVVPVGLIVLQLVAYLVVSTVALNEAQKAQQENAEDLIRAAVAATAELAEVLIPILLEQATAADAIDLDSTADLLREQADLLQSKIDNGGLSKVSKYALTNLGGTILAAVPCLNGFMITLSTPTPGVYLLPAGGRLYENYSVLPGASFLGRAIPGGACILVVPIYTQGIILFGGSSGI